MTHVGNGRQPVDPVEAEDGCPSCGQRESDMLVWIDEDRVQCQSCKAIYAPAGPRDDHDDPAS